jgi:hypothetical protein
MASPACRAPCSSRAGQAHQHRPWPPRPGLGWPAQRRAGRASAPASPAASRCASCAAPPAAMSSPTGRISNVDEAEGMTLFIALNEIRENQDPSLQFDFVCRAGICGSCGCSSTAARAGLPHADQRPRRHHHAGAAAGLRADRRPVGEHRQVDARHQRAPADLDPQQHAGRPDASRRAWSPSWPRPSTNSTAASSAAAAWPAAAPAMREASSARSASTRSPASGSTRATSAATPISTN